MLWIAFAGVEKWPAIVCPLQALGSVVGIMAIVYGLFWVTSLPVMAKRNSFWGNVLCVLVGLILAAIIAFVLVSGVYGRHSL
jgi:uncharacterized membrane protein HdeD (DUF308 family)